MPLVASTIPNLVSGVSQQPDASRLPTSAAEMINAYPSVVKGLIKRPPSEYIAQLSPVMTISSHAAVHMIDRDISEKYILVCGDGDLELYSEDGVKQTVTFPDGKSYLPTSDVWRSLRFVTVADTTFVLNTDVTVTASSVAETRPNPAETASVFVKRAIASVDYAIYVDGVLAANFVTSDNTSAGTALEGTAEIARELALSAVANGYADAVAVGTTVTFGITAGETVEVDDEFGGAAMEAYTDTLQEFENLPPREADDRLVRLQGNLDDGTAAYWVQYQNNVWTEVVGYNSAKELDAATMPHVLVKTGPSTFEFRQNTWSARPVGDDDSNPEPSYVNSTINGMFLFKGRLGFLSEENVILSSAGLFEDQWRTTVVQVLASDPIDVASATGRVSTLYHAASFSDELLLFSDKQQFRLTSNNVLSAETAGILNSTAYPCSRDVSPVPVGASTYFVSDGVTHTTAREVYVDGQRETVNGEDISVQVPAYIPKNVRSLIASSQTSSLFALSEDEPSSLYLYQWYEAERRKVQSAWCKWDFDDDTEIVGIGFLDRHLYLVYRTSTGVFIDRINVSSTIDLDLLLDHQVSTFDSIVYDGVSGLTTVTLPFSHPGTFEFYRTDNATLEPYSEGHTVTKVSDSVYTITGDVSAEAFTAGINYLFCYDFSRQYIREDTSSGQSAIQDGRLQLRSMSIHHTDTSYFEVEVTPTKGAEPYTYFYNGRTLADPDNLPDVIVSGRGEFQFPVLANSEDVKIQLKSDLPYRCSFGSVEWKATHKPKARRV